MSFKLTRLEALQLKAALVDQKVKDTALNALYLEGTKIEARAKEIITDKGHVKTGNLRRSIATESYVKPDGNLNARVGTNVFYSIFVELLPDGGYLLPAFIEKRREVLEGITNRLRDILRSLNK